MKTKKLWNLVLRSFDLTTDNLKRKYDPSSRTFLISLTKEKVSPVTFIKFNV